MKTPTRRKPTRKAPPVQPAPESVPAGRASPARRRQSRTLRYVLIEVMIVAVGVLLALGVDAARRTIEDHQRAEAIRSAFRDEVLVNRERLLRKMDRLRWAYRATLEHPDVAPDRVIQPGGNLIMLFFDTAWEEAAATDGLRLLGGEERAGLSELYASQRSLVTRQDAEMALWDDLIRYRSGSAASPEEARQRTAQVRRWRLAALRFHHHACRHLLRIQAALEHKRLALSSTDRCEGTEPLGTDLRTLFPDPAG